MVKKSPGHPGKTADIVRELTRPITDELQLLLWDVRFVKEGVDWFLRVYIDRADGPVGIDDCVAVSRRLSNRLDETDPIPQSYCLEVCSPGWERELTREEHFARFQGAPVRLRLYRPREDGKRELTGLLGDVTSDSLVLQTDSGEQLTMNRRDIVSVRLADGDLLE